MLKLDEGYFILNLKLNKDDLQTIDMKRKFFEMMDEMEEFLYAKYGEEKFVDINVLKELTEKAVNIQSEKKCTSRQAFIEAHEQYSKNIVTDSLDEFPREMVLKGVHFDYDMIKECSDFFRKAEIQQSVKNERPYYDDDMAWEISDEVFHEIKYSDVPLKKDSAISMVLKDYPAKDNSSYFVLYANAVGDAAVTYDSNIGITDFFKETLLEECKSAIVSAENYDKIKDKVYSAFETGYFSSPDGSVSFGCSRVNDDMTGSYSINGESCAPWKADSDYLRMADEILYRLSEENGFVPKQDKSLNFSFADAKGQEVSEPDFINGISSVYYGFPDHRDEKKAGELRMGNGVFEINVWFDDFIIKVKNAISSEFADELSVTRDDIKRSLDKDDFSKEDIFSVIKDKVTGFIFSDRKMRSAVMAAEKEDESRKGKQADEERKIAAEALSKASDVR